MRIVVSAGGTGGHIYPALAVIDKLKTKYKDLDVLYIGTKNRMESEIIPKRNIPFMGIEIYGFSKNIIKDFKNGYLILKDYYKCLKKLEEFKPDLVLGFGGYVTYPVIKAAKKLHIKTFLHEQNSVVGKTNKALAKNIDLVAVSFLSTIKKFSKAKKVIYSGNPCSEAALKAKVVKKKDVGLDDKKRLVIVVAGSLGSSTINTKMKDFLKISRRGDYQVLYITGKSHYEEFIKNEKFPSNVKVVDYMDNLAGLMKSADLIVTRAGASTMSEVLALSLPAIFIPSPYVAGNHQYYNALEIVNNNAGLMLEEKNLNGKNLFEMVSGLLENKQKYEIIKMNLKNMGITDSGEVILKEIGELIDEC